MKRIYFRYQRERSFEGAACFAVAALLLMLAVLPWAQDGWEVPVVGRVGAIAFAAGLGVYFAHDTVFCRAERSRMRRDGCSCHGVIVAKTVRGDRQANAYVYTVRYTSRLTGQELLFDTPVTSLCIGGEVDDIPCIVLEAYRSEAFVKRHGEPKIRAASGDAQAASAVTALIDYLAAED